MVSKTGGGGRRRTAAPLEQHRRGRDVDTEATRVTFILQDSPRVEVRVGITDWGRKGRVLEIVGIQAKLIVHPLTSNQVLIDSNTTE